ncbi:hypothetical protein [Clavibacter sp. VKM Ac-2873]|uniref:hypothetical protein n=1 Tax=Clavibacter sp. VKM Ac-2873 TaxID=2783813 RepID=UPI001E498F45|nr:hypothetical protein [Clavibacter sp. VKM Ac-2873]
MSERSELGIFHSVGSAAGVPASAGSAEMLPGVQTASLAAFWASSCICLLTCAGSCVWSSNWTGPAAVSAVAGNAPSPVIITVLVAMIAIVHLTLPAVRRLKTR